MLTTLGLRPGSRWTGLRARMTILYGALICTSGIALLGVTYLVAPGLIQHRAWQPAPGQPGAAPAGHTSGIFSSFLGSEAFRAAGGALGAMAVVSLALGWLIAGRFVSPLRSIITTSRDISASNLHRRLGLRGAPDEFTELGETLDDLFARLEASFEAQRLFIANASHELRTPLSASRAILQVALASPDVTVDSLQETCGKLIQLTDQQEGLIAALLTLAGNQRGLGETESIDLAQIAGKVIADRGLEAGKRDIRVTARLDAAPATGDPNLTESLIVNLIDNAIRHNRPGGKAEISTGLTDQGAAISVRNTGTLVPPDAVDQLFQPFRQSGAHRIRYGEGHGLGLAIVRAIADAHGARIVASPRPEGGLDMHVVFP